MCLWNSCLYRNSGVDDQVVEHKIEPSFYQYTLNSCSHVYCSSSQFILAGSATQSDFKSQRCGSVGRTLVGNCSTTRLLLPLSFLCCFLMDADVNSSNAVDLCILFGHITYNAKLYACICVGALRMKASGVTSFSFRSASEMLLCNIRTYCPEIFKFFIGLCHILESTQY